MSDFKDDIHILPPDYLNWEPGKLGDVVLCDRMHGHNVFHVRWEDLPQLEDYLVTHKFVLKGKDCLTICTACTASPDYALHKLADLP